MTVERIIEDWQERPFEWASTDCCQFVGQCVATFRGQNLVDFIDYGSEEDARMLIDEAGGLARLVSSVLGDPVERPPQKNDVVLVNDGDQDILGFVWQDRILLRTPGGLVDWPLERAEVTWEP